MKNAWLIFSLSIVCLVVLASVGEACPNCKENLAGDPTSDGLARGFYYSILFMVSMPFFILGSLSAYFYYLVKRDAAEKAKLITEANSLDVSLTS
jgi:hypothetical protein